MISGRSAAEQNVTDAVEEGVAELAEQIGAQGRKVDARASRIEGAFEEGVAELVEGQGALGRKVDARASRIEEKQAEMMTMISAVYDSLERGRQKRGRKGTVVTELGMDSVKVLKGKEAKLGKGSHGIVKRGEMKTDTGTVPVAVKVVDLEDEDARRALQRELEILVKSKLCCSWNKIVINP